MRPGWVHYDAYEITDGVIRPTAEAIAKGFHRYDSWERQASYQARKGGADRQLALGLIDLAQSLDSGDDLEGFAPKDERRIVAWCNKHGLLGLLPHQVVAVTLYSAIEPNSPHPIKYVRSPGTWYRGVISKHATSMVANGGGKAEGPAPTGTLALSLEDAVMRREQYSQPKWQPLSDFWANFFVDIPPDERETYRYQPPYGEGDKFWNVYCEPLRDFVDTIRLVADCASWLGMTKPPDEGGAYLEDVQFQVSETLSLLAGPVSMRLAKEDGGFVQVFESPSLLGEIASMMIEYLSPRRLVACEACDKMFVTDAYQKIFCSPTCANRVQVQRTRQKNRERDMALMRRAKRRGKVAWTAQNSSRIDRLFSDKVLVRATGGTQSDSAMHYKLTPIGKAKLKRMEAKVARKAAAASA